MRSDMSKCVTEQPRRGHANRSEKFRLRLSKREVEFAREDEVEIPAGFQPWCRKRNYDYKEFTDKLGPLRKYLRKQVGRRWDSVFSELSQHLDTRSITGQHIFSHVCGRAGEVERHCQLGYDGKPYRTVKTWHSNYPLTGLYVHPVSGLLCYEQERRYWRTSGKWRFQQQLAKFPVQVEKPGRWRIDGLMLWEHRDCGWFIREYQQVPERVEWYEREDGRKLPRIIPARIELVRLKQAGRKEMRAARALLERCPF